MKLFDNIKVFAGNIAYDVKKKKPELCLISGILCTIAAVGFACRATVKAMDVADDYKEQMDAVKRCEETGKTQKGEDYTQEDKKKDVATIKVQTGVKLLKMAVPVIAFTTGSVLSQVGVYKELKSQVILFAGAFTSLFDKFTDYRKNISEEYGADADYKAFHGIKAVIEKKDTGWKDEHGEPITEDIVHMVPVADDDDYSAIFDGENSDFWEPDFTQNISFLQAEQAMWTTILEKRKGRPVFLNEVRKRLGLKPTQLGQVAGWRYSTDPDHKGDNKVLFGIDKLWDAYWNGEEMPYDNAILLDFNVDGNVLCSVK